MTVDGSPGRGARLRERMRLGRQGYDGPVLRPSVSAVIDALAVLALIITAMTVLAGTFDSPVFLVTAAVGAVAGIFAAAVVLRLGAPMVTLALPVVVAAFLAGPPTVLRATQARGLPGPTGLAQMWAVIVGGWKELLTTLPPVSGTGRLTAIPFLIALIGAAVGFFVARRWRHPHLPLIGPVLGFAVALVFGLSAPVGITARALAFGLLAVAWGAERRRRLVVATGGGQVRRMATGAVLLAVASLAGASLAPALTPPASARAVLRDAVVPPVNLSDQPSPLSDFRRFRPVSAALADQELFTVSGLPEGTMVRLATVDSYAGTVWAAGQEGMTDGTGVGSSVSTVSSQGRFLRVGSQIPATQSGTPVSATITIGQAYADTPDLRIWVPAAGDPTRLGFTGSDAARLSEELRYNPVTDSALVLTGLSAGDTITLDAVLSENRTPTRVGAVGPTTAPSAYTAFVAPFVTSTPGASGGPLAAIQAVADRLRTTGAYTDGEGAESTFTPGHSIGRLSQFLGDPEPAGNDEQYAAALALVADYVGLPSRVVLGAVPEATGTVRGRDVRAYVQVQVDSTTWWTIPPDQFIPSRDRHPQPRQRTEENRAEAAVVPPPNEQRPPSSLEGFALDTTSSSRARSLVEQQGWTLPPWAVLTLRAASFPVGLLVLWTLALVAVKAIRRARRARHGSPGDRVAAAWDEVVDVLKDAGLPVAARHTRPELGAAAAQPGVAEVATLADRLTFGPTPVSDDDAIEAWAQVRRVRGQVRSGQRWRRRWRAAVSLTSILPDRVSTTPPVTPSDVHHAKVRPARVEQFVEIVG